MQYCGVQYRGLQDYVKSVPDPTINVPTSSIVTTFCLVVSGLPNNFAVVDPRRFSKDSRLIIFQAYVLWLYARTLPCPSKATNSPQVAVLSDHSKESRVVQRISTEKTSEEVVGGGYRSKEDRKKVLTVRHESFTTRAPHTLIVNTTFVTPQSQSTTTCENSGLDGAEKVLTRNLRVT
ncbi:hypothetical protein BDV95DRAFT_331681 [Massariosphaeria phaeospora]|uniref:Uncharacterized protein n=1 Tax=Massariosphaeria phaeospora TaxID=100035 RepID=A0A7C8MCN8_9PLEO|nr:hypothetical protein BDV95DRAFT_331681 [Massariosphaeria phaeospora]